MPITGITYEGVEFEGQKTRIKVGPLTCLPNENQYDLRQHLETIEQKADGTIEDMTAYEMKFNMLEQNNAKQNENIQKLHQEKTEQISKIVMNEAKITTLEQTDLQQNEEIKNLTDHENRIDDLEENDVKQDVDIQSLQSISHDEKTEQIEKIANHESRIDTLEKNDLEQENTLASITKCPSGKMFKAINGKCYAFENVLRSFQATQNRCGQIFGGLWQDGNGKIFEPRGDHVIKEVLKYAIIAWAGTSRTNPQTWLGITDESSEGNFVYPSDGQSHKLSWPFGMLGSYPNSRSSNCLLIHPDYVLSRGMVHYSCSATLAAICEWAI